MPGQRQGIVAMGGITALEIRGHGAEVFTLFFLETETEAPKRK